MKKRQIDKYNSYRFRLFLNSILILFIVKIIFFLQQERRMFMIYFVSFIEDLVILFLAYVIFSFNFNNRFKKIYDWAFYIIFSVLFLLSISYTSFLKDLLGYPINIFDITFEIINFFINNLITFSSVLILLTVFFAFLIISYYFPRKLNERKKILVFVFIFIIILKLFFNGPPPLNPVLYSFAQEFKSITEPDSGININKIVYPVTNYDANKNYSFLDKSGIDLTFKNISTKYKRVVIFVMESVNNEKFPKSDVKNDFFKNHCEHYSNYHTLNLDSYTALSTILNSKFIPYQSYVHKERYIGAEKNDNVVRLFDNLGYETHFISTYRYGQAVTPPDRSDWNREYFSENFSSDGFTCLDKNPVENACEDLEAFDKVIELLKNEKIVVLHEMVYGHASDWEEETGIRQMDYYWKYFNSVYDKLKENNILDNTLIVLVSDHGPRDDLTDIENYKVPLLICSSDSVAKINDNFSSHLDFKNILMSKLFGTEVKFDDTIYTIGSSLTLVYGKIKANGEYIFIKDQDLKPYYNSSKEEVKEFNTDFQNYMGYFEDSID